MQITKCNWTASKPPDAEGGASDAYITVMRHCDVICVCNCAEAICGGARDVLWATRGVKLAVRGVKRAMCDARCATHGVLYAVCDARCTTRSGSLGHHKNVTAVG